MGIPSRGSKSAGYGVWITIGGSSIRCHPFPLPLTDLPCQTSRMKNLTATLCLTIAVLLGSAAITSNPVLAEGVPKFECMPDQIKSPSQNGLAIIGDLSGFDPCNKTVEFRVQDGSSKTPIIISVHGGGGKKDAKRITDEFYKLGYSTLLFDAYNMNGIKLRRIKNADRQKMLLKTSFSAYEWVLQRPEINKNRIYFYGISNGASVVLNIAAMVDSSHVRGVIAEAPTPTGIGYPDKIKVPIMIIFGALDDFGAPPGKKRWEISDPCKWIVPFDFAPVGFSKNCSIYNSTGSTPTTMQWIKSVSRIENSFIDLVFVEGAAHAAFFGPLSVKTKDLLVLRRITGFTKQNEV
jgi:predicted esterase